MAVFIFGDYRFPEKYIEKGVKKKPNQRQDLDSYSDGYGVTQRTALAHTKTQIQFTTLPMSGDVMREIMAGMRSNYIDYKQRNANCTYYDNENSVFKTGQFYLDPSVEFDEEETDRDGIPTKYGEMEWLFIEY
ncbi:MAG: hypothetical protein NC489_19635 [Ruminococcus flavefaciens]|nr:hypothetical protein [Ruminococcus flavefaciens]